MALPDLSSSFGVNVHLLVQNRVQLLNTSKESGPWLPESDRRSRVSFSLSSQPKKSQRSSVATQTTSPGPVYAVWSSRVGAGEGASAGS
eukprot:CAMPEP_0119560630 /NCGR_PEP_ID=MMETSP1352-20130426/15482_1 /TAXON_ID=265584 /ORGANISM="Stauroneis constricta, Strain CCMP1120" /LENGTH=88 /DNA_ID=CAMNT_0007608663 /DNA_START=203 /DNA_END=469 /DNA_ORIENTATION=-